MCHSCSARRVLRSSSTLSQRCEFTVRSLLLHQGGIWPVPPFFVCSSTKHRALNQISKLCTTIAHRRSWRWIISTLVMPSPWERGRGASYPGSRLHPVMTGWRCWRGSAEPTTLLSLWAQSLHRKENTELKPHLWFMIYHFFCSLTCYFLPKDPKSAHLENAKKEWCQNNQKMWVKYRTVRVSDVCDKLKMWLQANTLIELCWKGTYTMNFSKFALCYNANRLIVAH